MPTTKINQNRLLNPLLGLLFVLLLLVQVRVAHDSYSQKTKHPSDSQELELLLAQEAESAASAGLLHDSNTNFLAAAIIALLLAVFSPFIVAPTYNFFPSAFSRNRCCIVPKGP